jgi:hypothetical protein
VTPDPDDNDFWNAPTPPAPPAWVFAAGYLWFELINRWFPDAAEGGCYYGWTWSQISWQMASLIVAFPAFLWATRCILCDQEANPAQPLSSLRRWITNIALLLTAVTFIGDLVTFVATFLQGGITMRFAMKSIVVFVLAAAVFLYYNRGLARVHTAVTRSGFLQTGSPAAQRLIAEDQRRVQDLYSMAAAVSRASKKEVLPEAPLARQHDGRSVYKDALRLQAYSLPQIRIVCRVFRSVHAGPARC